MSPTQPPTPNSTARNRGAANAFKDTVILPKTEFSMKADLVNREPERLRRWNEEGLYASILAAREGAPTFILHDGPPFANGDVHMGTALNKILKDFVVKSKSMAGFLSPFRPGWDCHGLPIEFKVVKESRGLSPVEVRRRSEAYARSYIDAQRSQFRRLGVLGDWENPYLTLDPAYEADELRAFAVFVEKGLVYQSRKPVHWSTGAQTALAEAEVEYLPKDSGSVFAAFPVSSGEWAGRAAVAIWTTTPWTLPANLAIAVNPDERYVVQPFRHAESGAERVLILAAKRVEKFAATTGWHAEGEPLAALSGRSLEGVVTRHPFLERDSPVVLADYVKMDTGTGAVHTAPGHGEDDYHTGRKYGLELLSPVDDLGRFTEEAGVPELTGRYVFDANPLVLDMLRARGAFLGEEVIHHDYPFCWRSKTPVVFRAVEQYFIRIDELRGAALEEIERVHWMPDWAKNRIRKTVEARPDWCISRQRSWGVPLPILYTADDQPILDPAVIRRVADMVAVHGTNRWFELDEAELARELGLPEGTRRRGTDTLDVWIDSGVSHQAVLERTPGLSFPADLYLEATDQHRGWFQSSLMTSLALRGCSPYLQCLTHGFVIHADGRKFSKSDNAASAEYFVNRFGADLVRLWAASVDYSEEVPFSEDAFQQLGDMYRRIRNTLRILLGNLHDLADPTPPAPGAGTLVDRWILHRLQVLIERCRVDYERFRFNEVLRAINQFCAVELSSLYIDITKDRLYCDPSDAPRRRTTQAVMRCVADAVIRLLAPILAFTADEAWEHLVGATGSVHTQLFPEVDERYLNPSAATRVDALVAVRALMAVKIEEARNAKRIGKSVEAAVQLALSDGELVAWIESNRPEAEEFLIVASVHASQASEGDGDMVVVEPSADVRCGRCWRHLPDVGSVASQPELCVRCADALA